MNPSLLIETRGAVRVLTLNRPEQLNAMDSELYTRLIEALRDADADDAVLAVVLRGAGTSFCSGADTREFSKLTPDQAELVEYRAGLTYGLHKTIPEMSKTVIAAIHGYAVGGGCGLALACDITIASENTRMGYPEIKHGLVAAVVMANLTKQVGRKAGFELVASGRLVKPAEALQMGMVTRVVPEGQEFEEAMRVAEDLCKRVPASLQATKRLYQAVADVPLSQGLELGRQANEAMRAYRADAIKNYAAAVQAAKDR
jgi:enoyl-CoA hydratase